MLHSVAFAWPTAIACYDFDRVASTTIQQNGERGVGGSVVIAVFRSQRVTSFNSATRCWLWLDTSLSQLHAGNLVVGRNQAYSGQYNAGSSEHLVSTKIERQH